MSIQSAGTSPYRRFYQASPCITMLVCLGGKAHWHIAYSIVQALSTSTCDALRTVMIALLK